MHDEETLPLAALRVQEEERHIEEVGRRIAEERRTEEVGRRTAEERHTEEVVLHTPAALLSTVGPHHNLQRAALGGLAVLSRL